MTKFAKSVLIDVLIAILLAGAILFFVRPTIVKQTSMQNTLNPNDYVVMYRRAYSGDKEPERGDIVIFESEMTDESGNDKLLIKRVIGLPGDTITIEGGMVYLNGEEYPESYLKDGYTPGDIRDVVVPEDSYFVMGDNRVVSVDSRFSEVGFVEKEDIKGKAVLRIYPFTEKHLL